MNGLMHKGTGGRIRRALDWLMTDWVWEVCLLLVVAPVVVDAFFSIGTNVSV